MHQQQQLEDALLLRLALAEQQLADGIVLDGSGDAAVLQEQEPGQCDAGEGHADGDELQRVLAVQQVFADPQVLARGLRLDLPNGLGSDTPQVASPLRLSATPVAYRSAPPLLGEHTDALLQRLLGVSEEAIVELRAAGVI